MDINVIKTVIYDQIEVIKSTTMVDRNVSFDNFDNYVVIGIRRAGKSTMLFKKVKDLIASGVSYEQIIYIDFSDEKLIGFNVDDFNDILVAANEISDKKHYFFFDEIQDIDGWERFARRLADQKYFVYITGSNSKMLSSEMESTLGGRYLSKRVYPFSFDEYLVFNSVDINNLSSNNVGKINSLLSSYFQYGGFPGSILLNNKREYLSNVFEKVLLHDTIEHNNVRNINGMRLLIKKIAETVKNEVSYTKLQSLITGIGYKISKDIIIDYVSYCKNSFLLFAIKNYHSVFLKKESNSKFYFMDNGLLSLFINNQDSQLLENIVAINLYQQYRDELFYLKSNKTGIDIDFYIPSKKLAIQTCYSLNDFSFESEVHSLVALAKKEKVTPLIITYSEDKDSLIDGVSIKVKSLKSFLLEN